MRILIKQFLGQPAHSWAVVGRELARGFKQLGHQVDLFATDGIKGFPGDLKENVIGYVEENQSKIFGKLPKTDYDCQISYTAMKNFPQYLTNSIKNRFGIWCYEWDGNNALPMGFAKHYKSCDFLIAPSQFAKQVFVNSKIPEDRIKVIPHGITSNYFNNTSKIDNLSNKKFKILANIAQNHMRKNIPGLLEAYGKAFTKKDDVCLILKGKHKPVQQPFDVSLNDCLSKFKTKYPNHAEIKLYSDYLDDLSSLYRSVDAVFTMSHCEGYYMPGIEALVSGKINICPNYGGQLDFLDNTNALLISGKSVVAEPKSMYWESKNNAIWFEPSIDDAVDKLRYAYHNFEKLNSALDIQKENVYHRYDWQIIASKFIYLCK